MRTAREDDFPEIIARIQRWWGDSRTPEESRELSLLLPRLFLQHFAGTSLVLADGNGIYGFLVGFHSADRADEAYIHFVGVDPARRGQGLARELYAAFFERAGRAGRTTVRAITSPGNTGSIAFHRAMGFELEPGDREAAGGVPVRDHYDGRDQPRVCFRIKLT